MFALACSATAQWQFHDVRGAAGVGGRTISVPTAGLSTSVDPATAGPAERLEAARDALRAARPDAGPASWEWALAGRSAGLPGVERFWFEARREGVPVFDAGATVLWTGEQRRVTIASGPTAAPPLRAEWTLDAGDALAAAGGPAEAAKTAQKVWFAVEGGLRPAWLCHFEQNSSESYQAVLDAEDGARLFVFPLAREADPRGRVFQAPHTAHPGEGARTMEPWTGEELGTACPAPVYPSQFRSGSLDGLCWTDGSETAGNNADACLDLNADHVCDLRASGTGGTFDEPYEDAYGSTGDPAADRMAALANAFYWTNTIHDWLWGLGFDETSGAFQADNFGRGGQDGDPVRVDVHDGGTNNNATFSTPPDGYSPRMSLGLFTGLRRDTAFDGDVIVHEYVHGLTNRLVAGPSSVSGLFLWHSGAMGEGWSDAYAADYTGDPVMGEYVTRNTTAGIRSVRYDQSDLTFGSFGLRSGVVPSGSGKILFLPQVHSDGEIWASALWRLREAIGSSAWGPLVTEALKLTPSRPSMLDARDAVVAAAAAQSVPACSVWAAFAASGMGAAAALNPTQSGQPNDTALSVYEAYDLPASCGGAPPATNRTLVDEGGETASGWTGDGLWHRTSRRAASGASSWWFGQEATGDYDTGSRVQGELISPAIDLSEADAAFLEWKQLFFGAGFFSRVELGGVFAPYLNQDAGRVWISGDDGANWFPLTHIAHNSSGSAFQTYRLNLKRFLGAVVRVKFEFDTLDGVNNAQEGWYLDDIRVTVRSTAAPELAISTTSLAFESAYEGPAAPAQSVGISNTGGPGLSWTAAPVSASWLNAAPGSGTGPGELSVTANPAGLPPGVHIGTVRIDGGAGGVETVTATLTVAAPAAPTAAWSFEESAHGPGLLLSDGSGGGHGMTTAGKGSANVAGVSGGARLFNGYSDSAWTASSADLTPTQMTVQTWVKLYRDPSPVGILVSAFGGANTRGWYLAVDSQRRVVFMAAQPPSSSPWLVTGASLTLGRWHLVTATYDGPTNQARVYIDGAQAASAIFPGLTPDDSAPITLGVASWAATWHLPGALDETEITPRVMSAAEIAGAYGAASPPADVVNLSTAVRFEFESGLTDLSGNGRHGSAIGSSTVSGVAGAARRFDGVDDWATVQIDELASSPDMTVRAWVRLHEQPSGWGVVAANYDGDFAGWYIGVLADRRAFVGVATKPSSLPSSVSSDGLDVGRWHHLTAVYEGRIQRLSLYVDGELADRTYTSGMTPRTAGAMTLGRASWIDAHYSPADLDELTIETTAWSAAEVAADYAGFPAVAAPNALADWSFDETSVGSSITLDDASGSGHAITTQGSKNGPQSGVSGDARYLGGAGGWASVPADADFSTNSFTYSGWVRVDAYPNSWGAIFSTYDGNHRGWYGAVDSQGRLILCVAGQPSSSPWLVTSQKVELGRWHHVAFSLEGASRRGLIYLDGVRVSSAVFPAWTPSSQAPTLAKASWANTGYLGVWLDETTLHGFERGADGIAADYAAGAERQDPAPEAEWLFDETGTGAGVVFADASSHGHDAVGQGFGGAATVGVEGGARRFSGFPDYALAGASAALSGDDFSWTGWVKLEALPSGYFGVLFANHSGDSCGWHGSVFSDGRLILAVSGQPNSNPWLVSSTALQVGVWTHVAFTFDGTARRGAIYVDGGRDRTAVFPAWTPAGGVDPTFGRASWTNNYYLPVTLDRVRLFDVELSIQEVAEEAGP